MEKTHTVIGYVAELYQPGLVHDPDDPEGQLVMDPGAGVADTGLDDPAVGILAFDTDSVPGGVNTLKIGDEIEMRLSFPPPTVERRYPKQDAVVSEVRKTGRQPGDTPETAFRIDDLASPASAEVLRDLTWKAVKIANAAPTNSKTYNHAEAMMNFGESTWNFGHLGMHEAEEYRNNHGTGRWPSVTSGEGSRAGTTTQSPDRTPQGRQDTAQGQEPARPLKPIRAGGDPQVPVPPPRTGRKASRTAQTHERTHQR